MCRFFQQCLCALPSTIAPIIPKLTLFPQERYQVQVFSLTRAKESWKAKRREGKEGRQEERIKRKTGSRSRDGFAQQDNNAGRIMRYIDDEYSPMYRIMIHDECRMTMRDLIRECELVIGPNIEDLPQRQWIILGPTPFHTLPLIILCRSSVTQGHFWLSPRGNDATE